MSAYNDRELRLATQIAYAELGDAYNVLVASGKGTKFTLSELRETALKLDPDANVGQLDDLSPEQLNTWSISGVRDTNNDTGFYACIVDTGDGNAIAAFRGSESMGSSPEQLKNIQHDWIEADIGLLNSTSTNQYAEAEKFLKDHSDLLNSYDSVDLTGHSLGGNLSAYSTIIADKYGLGSNFGRCVSFDGPGFSDEFLDHYKDEISRNAGKIDHYKWSFVGSMLNELPGERAQFIEVSKKSALNPFGRHSTSSIVYDENGNVKQGKQDFIAWLSEKFTNLVDDLPKPVGNTIAKALSTVLMMGFQNSGIAIAVIAAVVITHPVIIGVALAIYAIEIIGEYAEWVIDKVVDYVCKKVEEIKEWAKEKIKSFVAKVKEGVNKVKNWVKQKFSSAYRDAQKYLASNHVIRVNTDSLRDLASRLWAINGRLDHLDRSIDDLYRKVKWTDLWDLQRADFKIGWSGKLNKCADYLQDTAGRLEEAERKIMSMLG